MRIASKLLNCRVNMTYFVKNHDIFLIIFKKTKNRNRGSTVLIVFVKLVTHNLQNIL